MFIFAEANGLPSEGYRSSLSDFSADEVKRHLSEVLVVALPLNIHILVHVRPVLFYMFLFDLSAS